MDPLTHALAGATAAWTISGRAVGRRSLLIGAAVALLPDLDVFIRSDADPLLAIEHHRGFTHSLLFTAIVGVLAAIKWRRAGLAAAVAYATHPFLDAATTYGTQLFWPISDYRVGLDIISIIDPVFTLILFAGFCAAFAARRRVVLTALALAAAWLAIGVVQRERAIDAQKALAASRGHARHRGAVFPTIGNTIVWRSVYEAGGTIHIDRIRVGWFDDSTHRNVDAVPLVAAIDGSARMKRDFARFAWFSDGWVARDPSDATIIGDARYSLRSDRYEPVWGIRFRSNGDAPAEWIDRSRGRRIDLRETWDEIAGRRRPQLLH